MKRINSTMLTCCVSVVLLSGIECKAETKVPCIIASGNAEAERCIDLASFNRITFGENSMTISSSRDANKESLELFYSLYHHLEIRDADPTDINDGSVDAISEDSTSRIYVDEQAKLLHLQSTSDTEYSIGVFNISGHLLLTCELKNGDAITLDVLSPGIYIAVASDGKTKLSLKFILK